MKKNALFIAALLGSVVAGAQHRSIPGQNQAQTLEAPPSGSTDTIVVEGEKMWLGKEIDGDKLKKRKAESNSRYYGTQHRGYHMLTPTGEEINMMTSSNKISFFATWDPTCHYKLDKLNELQKQYKDNKDLQIVVVVFDTTGLSKLIADEKLELKFAQVRDGDEMNKVNCGNGYPGYIIMAKDNVIRGLGYLSDWDECMAALKRVL